MDEIRGVPTWQEELASLVDAGLRYDGAPIDLTAATESTAKRSSGYLDGSGSEARETLKDQVTGFMKSWGEMLLHLAKGCKDIVEQTVVTEDSYVVRKLAKPAAKVSKKLSFMNEYLPEDRDPVHAWPVIFFVFLLALAGKSSQCVVLSLRTACRFTNSNLCTKPDNCVPFYKCKRLYVPCIVTC